MTTRSAFETSCPVQLDLLALLIRCDEARLGAVVDELPELKRAALALYCFERYHLRRLGFAVALRCSESSLEAVGGTAGRHLVELARNAAEPGARQAPGGKRAAIPARKAA